MKSADLEAEAWEAVARIRKPHLDRLVELGCPLSALATACTDQPVLGLARIAPQRSGLYQPDAEGVASFILPVCVWDSFGPVVLDLIAWKPDDPRSWWWRVGMGSALGEYMLAEDYPVPVVRDPVEWLALGGNGVCILDWSATSPVWSMLRHGPGLTFTDNALRQSVRNALIKSAPLPSLELTDVA